MIIMAEELRQALLRAGLDPANPPTRSKPPASMAFAEYKKRGGDVYTTPDLFMADLIREVGRE